MAFESVEPRQLLAATNTVLVDDFLAQPLMSQVANGQEFSFYNVVGGDRGEVTCAAPGGTGPGGEVNWASGQVEAIVTEDGGCAGVFESVNHPFAEKLPLDFNALHPQEIVPQYQQRATALVIDLADGFGQFKVELKSPVDQVIWSQPVFLTGGPTRLRFDLPNPAPSNVQLISLIADGSANNHFVAQRIAIETVGADLGALEPFVWTYANLLSNYDAQTGLVRDRANFPSGAQDNVSATGGFALASVLAARRGIITMQAAQSIVSKVTATVLSLPTFRGVLPHFVTGTTNPTIILGTEWSSLDTVLTYTPLLLANELLELPTNQLEQAIASMDWDDLLLANGTISHGYTDAGQRLPNGWDTFGGETFLAVWARAAARPGEPLANVPNANPPTFNGSGFIDELAALYLPMPHVDVWGNNWDTYRQQAATRQTAHYAQVPVCCASAAEVPEPWKVSDDQIYQAFGIGGRIPDNDGTALLGQLVAAAHYPAMIAYAQPQAADDNWQFLKSQNAVSPLNVTESVYVVGDNGVPRAIWNPLKGSWNLLLATLGYEHALAGDQGYLPYQAALENDFIAAGRQRLTTLLSSIVGQADDQWWLAKSTGVSFQSELWATVASSRNWQDVQIGDFDGDGLQDASGRDTNGDWWVLRSRGFDFEAQVWGHWSTAVTWEDVVVGDFNGDMLSDIAGVTPNGRWWVAVSSGSSFVNVRWAVVASSQNWDDVLVGDFDGDGNQDITGRDPGGRWHVLQSTGGAFEDQVWGRWSTAVSWQNVVASDFNNDGRSDVAGRTPSGGWWIAVSRGSAFENQRWAVLPSSDSWIDVAVGDFDGDGLQDIAGRDSAGNWHVLRSTGSFFDDQVWGQWSPSVAWQDVVVADFNGDGRSDIAGRTPDGEWWLGVSDGSQLENQSWGQWPAVPSWRNVRAGKFATT